jgi:hypothetical protein
MDVLNIKLDGHACVAINASQVAPVMHWWLLLLCHFTLKVLAASQGRHTCSPEGSCVEYVVLVCFDCCVAAGMQWSVECAAAQHFTVQANMQVSGSGAVFRESRLIDRIKSKQKHCIYIGVTD